MTLKQTNVERRRSLIRGIIQKNPKAARSPKAILEMLRKVDTIGHCRRLMVKTVKKDLEAIYQENMNAKTEKLPGEDEIFKELRDAFILYRRTKDNGNGKKIAAYENALMVKHNLDKLFDQECRARKFRAASYQGLGAHARQDQIVKMFKTTKDIPTIAKELSVSRTTIYQDLKAIRRDGYELFDIDREETFLGYLEEVDKSVEELDNVIDEAKKEGENIIYKKDVSPLLQTRIAAIEKRLKFIQSKIDIGQKIGVYQTPTKNIEMKLSIEMRKEIIVKLVKELMPIIDNHIPSFEARSSAARELDVRIGELLSEGIIDEVNPPTTE